MSLPYRQAQLAVEARVADLLARMTQEEKIGQLLQFHKGGYEGNHARMHADIAAGKVGSRILADGGFAGAQGSGLSLEDTNATQRSAVEQSRLGIPLINGRDVIYGQKHVFPIPLAQAMSWNPELVEMAYTVVAREAAAVSVHWTFAPMMDISRDPRWGRVIESSGEDPYLAARMAVAAVRGLQGDDPSHPERILACAKHFVGYGLAEGGRDYDRAQVGMHELHNIHLVPFRAAAKAGVASVMAAFQQIDGIPASGHQGLMTDTLKVSWDWDGFIVSDWGSVEQLEQHGFAEDGRDAARLAFNAGIDMEMTQWRYRDHLAELIRAGLVPQSRLDDAVRRVLRAKFRAGLFEHPYTDPKLHEAVFARKDHRALCLQLAEQCPVLVRNNAVLPLPAQANLAVVGPFAQERRAHFGSWCMDSSPGELVTIADALRAALPQGKVLEPESPGADAALRLIQGSIWGGRERAHAVVVCVGEHQSRNGEASNIASLRLPAGQEEFIDAIGATGIPMIVVSCAGRPLPMPAAERYAAAILYAWNLGLCAGEAIARILTGQVEPTGRLAMTIARNEGQVPVYYNRPILGKVGDASSGSWYRPYVDQQFAPQYPFGFGLGYTSWRYSDLQVSAETIAANGSIQVSALVQNSGSRKGTTVVQCYLRDVAASVCRPQRELKSFCRIALEAGASERVSFTLSPEELGFYNRSAQFVVEPGTFHVWIGGDCTTDLKRSFQVV